MSFLTVLPLASVMIAGPQIVSATLLATGRDPRRNSRRAGLLGMGWPRATGVSAGHQDASPGRLWRWSIEIWSPWRWTTFHSPSSWR